MGQIAEPDSAVSALLPVYGFSSLYASRIILFNLLRLTAEGTVFLLTANKTALISPEQPFSGKEAVYTNVKKSPFTPFPILNRREIWFFFLRISRLRREWLCALFNA